MHSIRLSSPLSDACALVGALILFGAAVLDTPPPVGAMTDSAQTSAFDAAAQVGTTAHGAPRQAAR